VTRATTRTLLREDDGGLVRRTVLPGGLRVLTAHVPGVRSVSFGVWVGVGSRDETVRQHGCSHYLEHLLFKGTARRSALDISSSIDRLGGEMNAFTAKEYTCFYARVLDEDLPTAVDVVCDVVGSALVLASDVDSERGVILEEIAMNEDDPSDSVHDAFARAIFGETPLGRSILGTQESIERLSRETIHGYYRRNYTLDNLVVAVAGNVEHTAVVSLVKRAFADQLAGADPSAQPAERRPMRALTRHRPGVELVSRPTEQANLVLGVPGLSRTDERRYALAVLNGALGGGMSSRLFQEIREKRGLAYSVYSYNAQYSGAGLFGVYAGCVPSKVDQVLDICRAQLGRVAEDGITSDELARAKGQLRGGLVLGLEDTGSRMVRLGKGELVYGEVLSIDENLRRIGSVTLDDVRDVAADLLAAAPTLAIVGPFADDRDFSAAVA
jgi:predicted Zn-dependent peptidase